jgi:hypothetical protein
MGIRHCNMVTLDSKPLANWYYEGEESFDNLINSATCNQAVPGTELIQNNGANP